MSQEHTLPAVSDLLRALFKWLLELELESRSQATGGVTGPVTWSRLCPSLTANPTLNLSLCPSMHRQLSDSVRRLRRAWIAAAGPRPAAAGPPPAAGAGLKIHEGKCREFRYVLLSKDALYLLSFSVFTYSITSELLMLQNLQSQTLCFHLLRRNKKFPLHQSWYQLRLSTK